MHDDLGLAAAAMESLSAAPRCTGERRVALEGAAIDLADTLAEGWRLMRGFPRDELSRLSDNTFAVHAGESR